MYISSSQVHGSEWFRLLCERDVTWIGLLKGNAGAGIQSRKAPAPRRASAAPSTTESCISGSTAYDEPNKAIFLLEASNKLYRVIRTELRALPEEAGMEAGSCDRSAVSSSRRCCCCRSVAMSSGSLRRPSRCVSTCGARSKTCTTSASPCTAKLRSLNRQHLYCRTLTSPAY